MQIKHDVRKQMFFLVNAQNQVIGEIAYREDGNNQLCAYHTAVNPAYEGQGYAAKLLDALVNFAEKRDAKIVPTCSYVVQMFAKHPEKYAAVIK